MLTASPKISVIVPIYNEEESAVHLHKAIQDAFASIDSYEILFVDDGSTDNTLEICSSLAERDSRLRVIAFRKNYGQTPAMAAGIDNARGEILVTMDGDLQNDPSDIPMMVDKLHEGYDIVVGWRHNRQDKMLSRKIPSMIANRLIGWVTGVPIKDNGCSLKVYKAEVMQSLPFYSEMHRFIPALLSLSGARVAEVKVKHHARQFGESKYGLSRVYKVLLDLLMIKTILSLVDHPIRWFAKLSVVPFVIALLCMIYLVFQFAADASMIVTASVVMILFSMGSFLVGLGFLCELVYQRSPMKVDKLALLTARS